MATITLFQNSNEAESFPSGQSVFTAGEAGDLMYVVVEGEVDIVVQGKVLETVGAGGIVGEMALINTSARSASAIAKTDSKLVPINARRFQFLVQQTPFFALQVMEVMADRLRRMNEQVS